MSEKWTSGPWVIDRDYRPGMKHNNHIVSEPMPHLRVCFMAHDGDDENTESEANAHLIASAPDLYEALINIENDDGSIPDTIWEMRNAAISKARGE